MTRAAAGRAAEARAAAVAAASAFADWAATPVRDRIGLLQTASDALEAHADEVVEIACAEVGSSPDWVRFNVGIAAAMLRQTTDLADLLDSTESPVECGSHIGHPCRGRTFGLR